MTQPIVPCLWFDGNAEEAVNYYVRCWFQIWETIP